MSDVWQEFVKPGKLETEKKSLTDTYGKFTAAPFERGFAVTIGNTIRRHLLSSIQGAAVIAVKFEGVFHEFSTLPGVTEDIADIILNVKELRFKLDSDKPQKIHLKGKGKCKLSGKNIEADPSVTVMNPGHHLASLDTNGKLDLEMILTKGRGYVPSESNNQEETDTQMIPIDSIFSPVQKVNFYVENTRVGTSSDYEKLILEVWTDGSVIPEDAVAQSAKIIKDHLQIFINFDEEVEVKAPVVDETRQKVLDNLKKSVDELELSVRSYNCLKNADIKYLADLVVRTDNEMLKTQNFGRKSLNEIKLILDDMNITLGMNIDEYREDLEKEGVILTA